MTAGTSFLWIGCMQVCAATMTCKMINHLAFPHMYGTFLKSCLIFVDMDGICVANQFGMQTIF